MPSCRSLNCLSSRKRGYIRCGVIGIYPLKYVKREYRRAFCTFSRTQPANGEQTKTIGRSVLPRSRMRGRPVIPSGGPKFNSLDISCQIPFSQIRGERLPAPLLDVITVPRSRLSRGRMASALRRTRPDRRSTRRRVWRTPSPAPQDSKPPQVPLRSARARC
ncbi:hypothetical protein SDC9_83645 [bioreactor metagenome]|uniref:Uncharacterized protein n=1 Tax=bioreactor metagenome TaxID=1076179 RepID=A0A644Z832_9ZZZZ